MYSIDIFDDTRKAMPLWRALEDAHPGFVYQKFTWNDAWFRTVGAEHGITPAIVHIKAQGQSALVPLALCEHRQTRLLRYACGSHSNANGPLAGAAFPWPRNRNQGVALLRAIADAVGDIDAVALENQPLQFNGATHPFSLLRQTAAASDFYEGNLAADFERLAALRLKGDRRKKMRHKERRLSEIGAIRIVTPASETEAREILSEFFRQKDLRFRQQGIVNPFSEPGAADFITAAACAERGTPHAAIMLRAMFVGQSIAAVWGSLQDNARYTGVFTSFIEAETIAKYSPGDLLLLEEIKNCCMRGQTVIDLGIGAARYKNVWCDHVIPVFETHLAFTPAGAIYSGLLRARANAKRIVKNNRLLLALLQKARPAAD